LFLQYLAERLENTQEYSDLFKNCRDVHYSSRHQITSFKVTGKTYNVATRVQVQHDFNFVYVPEKTTKSIPEYPCIYEHWEFISCAGTLQRKTEGESREIVKGREIKDSTRER
jgi:hypothetical protein